MVALASGGVSCALVCGDVCVQLTAVRRLATADLSVASAFGNVSLSHYSRLPGGVTTVDTVLTTWSTNPFPSLGAASAPTSAIVEFTLRNVDSGADVPLPVVHFADGTLPPAMPFQFLVPTTTGESVCDKRHCAVDIPSSTSIPFADCMCACVSASD